MKVEHIQIFSPLGLIQLFHLSAKRFCFFLESGKREEQGGRGGEEEENMAKQSYHVLNSQLGQL